MTLQEQCCTIQQGKRLVELGVPAAGTAFWHMPAKSGPHGEYIRYGWQGDAIAPAYNVAELGHILKEKGTPMYWNLWREWCYKDGENVRGYTHEAVARAAMLIHLLENNILTFKPGTVTLAE